MATIKEAVDVEVPVRVAYNQWTQFETFPRFMEGVESVQQLDEIHNHWVTDFDGVRREFDTEITEQVPDERVAWHTIGGDLEQAGVVTFRRLDDSMTRVMIQIDWQPEGITEKTGAAIGSDDRRVKADAERFKRFIEERGRETGAWRGSVS
jgi:uncharacterized membrane protein